MVVHERPVGATVEWYTPASLFEALGATFDLDPAAAPFPAVVPANRHWTRADDGLSRDWYGHVWLNPPHGPSGVAFVNRMIAHADGLLFLPSRTETAIYQRALAAADAVCFLRDRLWFTRNDGLTGRSSFGSTLFAFGDWATAILVTSDLGWTTLGTDANRKDRNHYDWFMPPARAVDEEFLTATEAKMTEALTDPFVHDMAQVVLQLCAALRRDRPDAIRYRHYRDRRKASERRRLAFRRIGA